MSGHESTYNAIIAARVVKQTNVLNCTVLRLQHAGNYQCQRHKGMNYLFLGTLLQ